MIDEIAHDIALHRYGLAACLHVPIAAVDEAAVTTYVGDVLQAVGGGGQRRALLVRARPPAPPDPRFPVWAMAGSNTLRQPLQLWVDVTYTRYRQAWRTAFPDRDTREAASAADDRHPERSGSYPPPADDRRLT